MGLRSLLYGTYERQLTRTLKEQGEIPRHIGVILDGGGDDVYEFDYLAHGGGYWCGLGFARDFGGNDQRLGATRTTYSGGQRRERRFQRFGCGYGCHFALGFCFDAVGRILAEHFGCKSRKIERNADFAGGFMPGPRRGDLVGQGLLQADHGWPPWADLDSSVRATC